MRRSLLALALLLGSVFAVTSARADDSSTYNFRFSPIGLIVGSVTVGLDIAVAPEWTIGPTLNYWHLDLSSDRSTYSENFNITTYGAGARANWFKNGNYTDGLYIGPSLKYVNVNLATKDKNGKTINGSLGGVVAGALIGYGWFWESFNMMLGIGGTYGLGNTTVDVKDANGYTTTTQNVLSGLDGEFSLGWTF